MSNKSHERDSNRVWTKSFTKRKPKAAQSPWPRQEGMLKFNPPELNDDERCSLQMMEAERKMIERKIAMVVIDPLQDVIKKGGGK